MKGVTPRFTLKRNDLCAVKVGVCHFVHGHFLGLMLLATVVDSPPVSVDETCGGYTVRMPEEKCTLVHRLESCCARVSAYLVCEQCASAGFCHFEGLIFRWYMVICECRTQLAKVLEADRRKEAVFSRTDCNVGALISVSAAV